MPFTTPPVVLLPGTLCDERVFAPLLASLRQQVDSVPAIVIMTAHCLTMRAAADHVLSVAPPRFALLGFSLGGIVALEVSSLAPERVLGLALLNVSAAPTPASLRGQRRQAVSEAQVMGHGDYVRDKLWKKYVGPSSQTNAALKELIASMAQDLGHAAFYHQTEAALSRRDYRPLLHLFTMPTLVQAGEFDVVCPATDQRSVAEAIPNADFVLVPDAGHFALLEQEDVVATSVAAWFHKIQGDASV